MELVIMVPPSRLLKKEHKALESSVCPLWNVRHSTAMLILSANISDFPHTIINAYFLGVPTNPLCTCWHAVAVRPQVLIMEIPGWFVFFSNFSCWVQEVEVEISLQRCGLPI